MNVSDSFCGLEFNWIVKKDNTVACRANEIVEFIGLNPLHTSRVLKSKVFKEYYFFYSEETVGRPFLYLYEPGVWQLLFTANKDGCVKLQKHIFEVVIPRLRKEGYYISEDITNEQLEQAKQKIETLENKLEINRQFITSELEDAKQRGLEEGKKEAIALYSIENDAPTGNPISFEQYRSNNSSEDEYYEKLRDCQGEGICLLQRMRTIIKGSNKTTMRRFNEILEKNKENRAGLKTYFDELEPIEV